MAIRNGAEYGIDKNQYMSALWAARSCIANVAIPNTRKVFDTAVEAIPENMRERVFADIMQYAQPHKGSPLKPHRDRIILQFVLSRP